MPKKDVYYMFERTDKQVRKAAKDLEVNFLTPPNRPSYGNCIWRSLRTP